VVSTFTSTLDRLFELWMMAVWSWQPESRVLLPGTWVFLRVLRQIQLDQSAPSNHDVSQTPNERTNSLITLLTQNLLSAAVVFKP